MKKDIIDQIKKCLKLGQSPNANEAAAAIAKAKHLMDKYNITATDLELSEVIEAQSKLPKREKRTAYESMLVQTICEVFGCTYFFRWNEVVFIGLEANAEIAKYAFTVLFNKMVSARAEFIAKYCKRMRKKQRKTQLADEYAFGWAIGVATAAEKIPKAPVPGNIPAYLTKHYPKLSTKPVLRRKLKGSSSSSSNEMGFSRGYHDGSSVELNAAVNGVVSNPQIEQS